MNIIFDRIEQNYIFEIMYKDIIICYIHFIIKILYYLKEILIQHRYIFNIYFRKYVSRILQNSSHKIKNRVK